MACFTTAFVPDVAFTLFHPSVGFGKCEQRSAGLVLVCFRPLWNAFEVFICRGTVSLALFPILSEIGDLCQVSKARVPRVNTYDKMAHGFLYTSLRSRHRLTPFGRG